MSDDDDQADAPPDQWWLLAVPAWAPCFFYFWLVRGEQFKGSLIGGILGGIVIGCGFYSTRFRSPLLWMTALGLAVTQAAVLSLLKIPNYHGASFGILFPVVLAEVGVTYFVIHYVLRALGDAGER